MEESDEDTTGMENMREKTCKVVSLELARIETDEREFYLEKFLP